MARILRRVLEKKLSSSKTLMQVVRIYSDDMRMEFSVEKCTMLIMKCGKRQKTEGIELPNQKNFRRFEEKETYKYWAHWKQTWSYKWWSKKKIQKAYVKWMRKLFETKLLCRNLMKRVNTWFVPCKILATILKVYARRISTNPSVNKKTHEDA